MKTALLEAERTNNPREKADRCTRWRPRIIESAEEPDFLLRFKAGPHLVSSLRAQFGGSILEETMNTWAELAS